MCVSKVTDKDKNKERKFESAKHRTKQRVRTPLRTHVVRTVSVHKDLVFGSLTELKQDHM
ncbi:hypothetical protein PUN28_008217 [Cardiocondyla obscurior]|uniref:Uncharacterized protein n=1 Tax=Cardiocondyla obscurior TaxID=286306 RepID=A0AAW2G024_9HYME